MQNCGMPPPICNLGREFEHKNGQNLTNNLSFYLHLILGRKTEWFWVEKFFFLVFIILKFPGTPPPPFENSAYASGEDNRSRYSFEDFDQRWELAKKFLALGLYYLFYCFF